MFSIFKHKRRDGEERVADDGDDRDLVVLVNEARTPEELHGALTLARMRRS